MMKARGTMRWALAGLALLFAGVGVAEAQPWLVEDGQARAEIVIADDPPRTTRLAAWELQNYVRKISGATLPIVHEPSDDAAVQVYIGASAHTDKLGITDQGLDYGAYRMVSGDDWLVLIGKDTNHEPVEPYTRTRSDRGSEEIIAAWDEISGGKWVHPEGNAFKMLFRNVDQHFRDGGADEPMNLWAYDERGSYNAVCDFLRDLGVRWYMPGELGEVVPETSSIALPQVDRRVEPDFPVRDNNVRFGVHDTRVSIWAMRMGMRQPYGFGWAHGLNLITGREQTKRDHPEYYALYAGERATDFRSGGKQCLSSPGLFESSVDYARTVFDHYGHPVISLQPADGYTSLCQCQLCEGKDSPDRAYRGRMSDYVWDFTVRVANELAKTRPDLQVSNMGYNLYRLPPENIEKMPENVLVALIGARRPTVVNPEQRQEIRDIRESWYDKTEHQLLNFENYPLTARGYWLPAFTPHTNAESINAIKGKFLGENIQPSAHRFMEAAAFNSFQFYFTFRMYWGGKDRDIDPMLEEYYELFYGPAASQMKAFFEYCEAHWQDMDDDKAKTDQALALFDAARQQADEGSVYDQRLAVMAEYLENLAARSKQIEKEKQRENVPSVQMWRGATSVEIDGRLDDEFWQEMPGGRGGTLRELQTGRRPMFGTTFKVAWGGDAIYFAIRCEDVADDTVKIGTDRDEDAALWYGDAVEILLETEQNSYYQIAISPSGAVADLNRTGGQQIFRWDSQAEVATHIGEDYWTAEVRIPVMASSNDPFHQVIGERPRNNLPWYFNVCRQRIRENGRELSAFSPTGKAGFHVPERFSKLYYK